jgi:hypothetical protein
VAIAHQSETAGIANTAAGNYDTTVSPAAAPQAVCCLIVDSSSIIDTVTSVAYGISTGAVTLTRRRRDTESTEAGGVFLYWAAGTFPAGSQTCRIVRTGTDNLRAVWYTMTVTDPASFTVAVDSDATGTSTSVANPSWAHASLVDNVVAYLAIHSGLNAMTATPATNWTLTTSEDVGNFGRGWARRTLGTAGALAPGWTASTADDFVGNSGAFKEVPITAVATGRQAAVSRRAVNRAATW